MFCDTDSLAIVGNEDGGLLACPGGRHRLCDGREAVKALSWAEVEEVRQRFAALNPYEPDAVSGSVLKAEDENFDKVTGEQRELYCYAISAKRYVMYNLDADGRPVIRKYSRHGLGHLLNPSDPDSREHDWIEEIWHYIIAADVLGESPQAPSWFTRPALGRVGINDPRTLTLFAALNKGRPYAAQVKPQNFLLSAQVAPLGHPPGIDPLKPFHLYRSVQRRPEPMAEAALHGPLQRQGVPRDYRRRARARGRPGEDLCRCGRRIPLSSRIQESRARWTAVLADNRRSVAAQASRSATRHLRG